MAYKVFLSHSTRDQGLVMALAGLLTRSGVEVMVAEWYIGAGQNLSAKVRRQIRAADSVVVFLTRNGARSRWVQQEIGIGLGAGKLVIPLVEQGTSQDDLAALAGTEYIEYDPVRPRDALDRAARYVSSLKVKKDAKQQALLVAGGLMAFLLLLSGNSK